MHNLFLGTAKHMMEMWLELSILTGADLKRAEQKVDTSNVPSNIACFLFKIGAAMCE
jgi:hypothetical protein